MTRPVLPPQQTNEPEALAEDVAARLAAWAELHPTIRRGRIKPVSMQMAASAPFASPEALSLTLQLGLWIAGVDDLLDEGQAATTDVAERLQSFEDPAQVARQGDDLAAMLHETFADLACQPLFPALEAHWRKALGDHLQGHLQEHVWRSDSLHDPAALPSYVDYLAVGRRTIGFPLIPWTFLIADGDPAALLDLTALGAMAATAGVCLRLANDLRSHERELGEGKINAVVILSQAALGQGANSVEARQMAERRMAADIDAGLADLWRQRDSLASICDRAAAAILGMAETGCQFYHRRDFHVAA